MLFTSPTHMPQTASRLWSGLPPKVNISKHQLFLHLNIHPHQQPAMANSRFEYVRNFELPDPLLPETWIVVRIDGRAFTKCVERTGAQSP